MTERLFSTKLNLTPDSQRFSQPLVSSTTQQWKEIIVEQFYLPPGETEPKSFEEHTICFCLSPQPLLVEQQFGDRRIEQIHRSGDISIYPAKVPNAERWHSDDLFLHLRLQPKLLKRVALEAADIDSNLIELSTKSKTRDSFLEQIAMSLLSELKTGGLAGKLYVDSMINVLAIHLLRNYCYTNKQLSKPSGALSKRKLQQAIDYIQAHLDEEIRLENIARNVEIDSSYFCQLFKNSMGVSPYNYVIQQRIERAKQLLSKSNLSITHVALECGFADSSHFAKHFRKTAGMSATKYRRQII